MNNYSGVLFGRKETNWIGGVSSPIETVRLTDGNWSEYKPEHEIQFMNSGEMNAFETSACVSFSSTDCIETLFMYYLKNSLIPPTHVLWLREKGYFVDGFINFSDRFVAINGGTQKNGAYQYRVADGVISKGMVPETIFPTGGNNQLEYLDITKITNDIYKLGEEFKKMFTINWFWVEKDNIEEYLTMSPLQAIVKYADGEGILKPDGTYNHAIMVQDSRTDYYLINDSYSKELKKYDKDYVGSFLGFSLTINNNKIDMGDFIKNNDLKYVRNINTGAFARIINGKLRTIDSKDRGVLLLLDAEHRKNGVSINSDEWEALPKENF